MARLDLRRKLPEASAMFGHYRGIIIYLLAGWAIAVVLLLLGYAVASWWSRDRNRL